MGKYEILQRNAMTLLCGQKQLLIDTHATTMHFKHLKTTYIENLKITQ